MFHLIRKPLGAALLLALSSFALPAAASDILGAGATFPYPVYAKWAGAYKAETGTGLNYQAIGSGGGIKQIKARTVTFGASDMPMKPEDLAKDGLIQWPQIVGGVVPVVNVHGVAPGAMVLDASTLAAIFLGEIKSWDDPEIAKLNPKLKLPHTPVVQVYRADGSGTNFLFTHYLSQAVPKFEAAVGEGTSVQWPAGIGAKGNEGVAGQVKQTEGAIGYVEYAYAKQNSLSHVKLSNKDGGVVQASQQSFQAAAGHADWPKAPGFYLILTNQSGKDSWPITGASFILMPKAPSNGAAVQEALAFFRWSFQKGAASAEALDYVPLPASVIQAVEQSWDQIKTP